MGNTITLTQAQFKTIINHTLRLAHATSTDHVVAANSGLAFDVLEAYVHDVDAVNGSGPFTEEQAPVIGLLYQLIGIAKASGEWDGIDALKTFDAVQVAESVNDIGAAHYQIQNSPKGAHV